MLACVLVACSPEPAPTPELEPTGFASEEEAFAAAEKVYREYTEALNNVDTSDPATFEPVYALASGSFLANDKENLSYVHAEAFVYTGSTQVISFTGIDADLKAGVIRGRLCLDIEHVMLTTASGESLIAADREDTNVIDVSFLGSPAKLTIDSATNAEDPKCVKR